MSRCRASAAQSFSGRIARPFKARRSRGRLACITSARAVKYRHFIGRYQIVWSRKGVPVVGLHPEYGGPWWADLRVRKNGSGFRILHLHLLWDSPRRSFAQLRTGPVHPRLRNHSNSRAHGMPAGTILRSLTQTCRARSCCFSCLSSRVYSGIQGHCSQLHMKHLVICRVPVTLQSLCKSLRLRVGQGCRSLAK